MPIRAVTLDYDGVNIDSAREGRKRLINILRSRGFGLNKKIRQQIKASWGTPPVEFLRNCFGMDSRTANDINQEWERLDISAPPPLIPGAQNTLTWLNEFGFRVTLLTSRRRPILRQSLKIYGLRNYFDLIQSQDDWPFLKPDPRAFRYTLRWLFKKSVTPEECIYVGDTPVDFVAATGAGIKNLSVLTGIFSKADFLKIGQKKENIINSIAELPTWIRLRQDC